MPSYINRKWLFLLIVLIFLLLNIWVWFLDKPEIEFNSGTVVFSKYTGLYLYSALLQANAAILSLAGIFFIFKIQLLYNSLENSKTNLKQSYLRPNYGYVVEEFSNKTLEDQKKETDNWDSIRGKDLLNGFKKIYSIGLQIRQTKKAIKLPTVLVVIALATNIVFLSLASYINSVGYPFELITIAFTIIFEFLVLVIVIKAIFSVIKKTN